MPDREEFGLRQASSSRTAIQYHFTSRLDSFCLLQQGSDPVCIMARDTGAFMLLLCILCTCNDYVSAFTTSGGLVFGSRRMDVSLLRGRAEGVKKGKGHCMRDGGMTDLGDLAILGAVKKLRGGDLTKTRSIHFPG